MPEPTIKPSVRHSGNLPNSDLKPGDHILIREWVGERAFIKTVVPDGMSNPISAMLGVTQKFSATDDGEGCVLNTQFFGDVLRIDAVQYPHAIATVWSPGDHPKYVQLDLRAFEASAADPDYVSAIKASSSSVVCPCLGCATNRRRESRRWYKPWTWGR